MNEKRKISNMSQSKFSGLKQKIKKLMNQKLTTLIVVEIGKRLDKIKYNRGYMNDGYNTFDEWLYSDDSIIARRTAYNYIRIYKLIRGTKLFLKEFQNTEYSKILGIASKIKEEENPGKIKALINQTRSKSQSELRMARPNDMSGTATVFKILSNPNPAVGRSIILRKIRIDVYDSAGDIILNEIFRTHRVRFKLVVIDG